MHILEMEGGGRTGNKETASPSTAFSFSIRREGILCRESSLQGRQYNADSLSCLLIDIFTEHPVQQVFEAFHRTRIFRQVPLCETGVCVWGHCVFEFFDGSRVCGGLDA